jgi:hypothetical protein
MKTLILCTLVALLAGCTRDARLTIVNRSAAELTNVVASGSGFTQAVGTLAPGERRSMNVRPRGESGLRLDFDSGGKHFSSAPLGYFEGGYKVAATVSPEFNVTVDAKL